MNSTRTIARRGGPIAPAPRRPFGRYAAYALCAVVLVALVAAAVAEWRYRFLVAGPRVNRTPITTGAGVIAVIDPSKLISLAAEEMRAGTSWPLPDWAVRRILPHEGGVAAALDFEQQRVEIRVFVNPQGLAPVARQWGETLRFSDEFPRIRWKKTAVEPVRGLVMKEGVVPFAPEAEDAFWYTWSQSIQPAPLRFEGGHLIEAVFDNRQGHAFLIVTSILDAYDVELGADEADISLSSLQFVRDARLTADLAPGDVLRIRFVLEILPEHIDKLGVVNLKVGLDDVLKEMSERWQRDHDLTLEGSSAWDGSRIVYDYRLSSARRAFHLIVHGELL